MSQFIENIKERIRAVEARMANDAKTLEAYRQILQDEERNQATGDLPAAEATAKQAVETIVLGDLFPSEGITVVSEETIEDNAEADEVEGPASELSSQDFALSIIKKGGSKGVTPRAINEAFIESGRITRGSNHAYSQLDQLKKKHIIESIDGLYYMAGKKEEKKKLIPKSKRLAAGA